MIKMMDSKPGTSFVFEPCSGLLTRGANKRRVSHEDLSPPPTPISASNIQLNTSENTQSILEVSVKYNVYSS